MKIITKHYLDKKMGNLNVSHSIFPLEGTNSPTGKQDPAEESANEDEFEEERLRREEKLENQSEL